MISLITAVNLSSVDLNLLHVVAVVLEERSATRAARRLGVTQSAVSNALARARDVFGDPLLVRAGRGMTPTPTAERLLPELTAAMSQLKAALDRGQRFDPRTYSGELTIACADSSQIADVPLIVTALAEEMPLARLRVVNVDYLIASGGLSESDVDAAIGLRKSAPGVRLVPLYREPPVAVVRRDHPIVGERLLRRDFSRLRFIDLHISLGRPGRGHAIVERALRARGLVRRIGLVVPGFAAAAMAAVATDLVAFMPLRVARTFAQHLPVRVVDMPVADLAHEIWLGWHERTHKEPAAAHLRRVIIKTLREQPAPAAPRPRARARG